MEEFSQNHRSGSGVPAPRSHHVADLSLGDRPLAVIGALGYLPNEADREDRRARQKRLAALSTKSTLMILDDAPHYLPLLRPELVVSAIHDVVDRARAR